MPMSLNRRGLLAGTAAALAAPSVIRAQAEPIRLGALNPLTGAGGPYGPSMRKAIEGIVEAVNAAGGIGGRRVQLFGEDTQTNPDAAVRAARKLIDVDRVAAIMGTWASAVTTAVAPLCWESRTMLFTVSGADSITQLPHRGFIIRTQPNSSLQITKLAEFLGERGARNIFILAAQTPFAEPNRVILEREMPKYGGRVAGQVIYDRDKTVFRSEVDQALRARPDYIFLNGYTPDVTIILRELFRAGWTGGKVAPAYAVNQRLLDSLPAEVTNGTVTWAPSPDVESPAFKRLQALLGTNDPDPYSCQTNDHASLACLAIARAGAATGEAIREHVRQISQGGGERVTDVVEGLRLLREGRKIDYAGASGACDFTDTGDILTCPFRYEIAEGAKLRTLRIA
ncbi:amino acid ABC transporter substrate-binding protein [Elioraea sp. Yellowstone]|jgi:branched-chain amino acid transport system substrate-binding protein|uniref:ABC transporter substrate-binding protein n=1 Tax=Elioraea sp. Yellowstone TaxID=2592070 RepID=UPI0011534F30|nr:ABC transporter substrate-binding protein [Elioraea sp. Yellowstone]TQF82766.1 amino acid ABC transporter substrate-binding protein [Elioraea sp. Yellowstone]